jgi:hypothetical protein
VFGFAGYQSTFGSKDEWKRHVSSQHLKLCTWLCELDACEGREFNRKDLFTQHLTRMHTPLEVRRQKDKMTYGWMRTEAEWKGRLEELQNSCLRVKRQLPAKLACPVEECCAVFKDANCWDARMDHMGKHLEKAARSIGPDILVVEQQDDQLLVDWALRERIIEKKRTGDFQLCSIE